MIVRFARFALIVSLVPQALGACDEKHVWLSHTPTVPAHTKPVSADARALRALRESSLVVGDRLYVGVTKATRSADRVDRLDIADTSALFFDHTGLLHARRAGSFLLRWFEGSGRDSALVRVVDAGLRAVNVGAWVAPAPVKQRVDVRYPVLTGTSRRVGAGEDLQAALNVAQPGDEVVLAAGAVFTSNYVLPKKTTGTGWIVVRAEQVSVAAGTRMTPALAAGVAIVKSPNSDPAIGSAQGASRYRLVGFEVTQATGLPINYGLVVLGRGDQADNALALLPSDIVLDRMYIHGTLTDDLKRCVTFNGRALAVIDSWLSECHGKGFDSQGVAGWNGPGPFLIENNHIEGAGQAVLFGGSDPYIAGLSPSDIVIRRNHMFKPLSWGNGKWTVKATFELKHGKRVLFEGNVLENHWADAQVGFAMLFQTVSQYGAAPWTTIQDVLVQDNVIKNSRSGVNMLSRMTSILPIPINGTARVAVVNNLFQEVGRDPISGDNGSVFQLLSDLQDISIVNNTVTLSGTARHALSMDYLPQTRLTLVNNVFPMTEYGIFGSGYGSGTPALAQYAPSATVVGNVIPGQRKSAYPTSNTFPAHGLMMPKAASLPSPNYCETDVTNELPNGVGVDCIMLRKRSTAVRDQLP